MNTATRYFDTARERDEAMRNGTAPEPGPIKPLVIRPYQPREVPEVPIPKYHWEGSRCVRVNYDRWTWGVRERILGDEAFEKCVEQCQYCLFDFANR